jgi:ATP-dependent Clp protease protease subunit
MNMDENIKVLDIVIPEEIEDVKLPSPELVKYYKDYDNRNIAIDYDIDESLFEVTKQILEYNRQDKDISTDKRKPINIYVMSYGGELYQAYALISTMLASKTPIRTINMGVAMSAGLLILLAGHERYAMKYSTAMIHSGSGGAQGTYEQMEEQQKNYKKLVDMMRDYILERTNIDTKLFNRQKSKDWYLNDKEQVELGIVSKIIDNLDEII